MVSYISSVSERRTRGSGNESLETCMLVSKTAQFRSYVEGELLFMGKLARFSILQTSTASCSKLLYSSGQLQITSYIQRSTRS